MPRKKVTQSAVIEEGSPESRLPGKDAEWGGYINIRLSDSDKEAARAWIDHNTTVILVELSDELWLGFKLSVAADVSNECFIATLTGTPFHGSSLRCSLSARGGTWFEALALCMYKHVVMSNRNWGQYRTDGVKVDPFG